MLFPARILSSVLLLFFLSVMGSPLVAQAPADSAAPETGLYELSSGEVAFHSGTQIENFTGETTQVEGQLHTGTGSFSFRVDMASVSTGNNRRDRNMREDYMETEQYPYVSYEGEIQDMPNPEAATSPQTVRSTGRFTIKDQTREVEIDGQLRYDPEAGTWHVEARFYIMLSDYGISRPRWLFIRMQDEQEIELSFELNEAS